MPPPEGRGRIEATMDALFEAEATIHESLSCYLFWRPDMQLPALWNWWTPGSTERKDNCTASDRLRITVSIGVDPTAVAGEGDMRDAMVYADRAIDVLNAAVFTRNPLGQREASRNGLQTVADQLGDAQILVVEFPIEVVLDRSVQPNP